MASLSLSGSAVRSPPSPSQAIPGFRRPNRKIVKLPCPGLSQTSPRFRIKGLLRQKIEQRVFEAYASNSNPSGGDSIEEKSDGNTTSDAAAQGPPFLTILAGLLVFFGVFWIVGSIIMWLISLIFSLASPK